MCLFLILPDTFSPYKLNHPRKIDSQAKVVLPFLTDYGPLTGNGPDVLPVRTGYAPRALGMERRPFISWNIPVEHSLVAAKEKNLKIWIFGGKVVNLQRSVE